MVGQGPEDVIVPVSVQRDLEYNRGLIKVIREYWAALGHEVFLTLVYDETRGMHHIRSDLKNGLPDGPLTHLARNKLL